jgi:hypothetical protein
MNRQRLLRLRVLELLEQRAKQFRSREELWPFRVPHEPLLLDSLIEEALEGGSLPSDALRSRNVLRLEWPGAETGGDHSWEAWVATLPSGVSLYCDTDPDESRILASVKRANPAEADRFFLELLAESRGHYFGLDLSGTAPDRVRSPLRDPEFLVDVFVELFEGTAAEAAIHGGADRHLVQPDNLGRDFRREVQGWLGHVLAGSPDRPREGRRRPRRLRDGF